MPREQTPGTNLRKLHINVILTSVGHHVPLKIAMGFAKDFCGGRFLLAKMSVSTSKSLEGPFVYIYIYVCMYVCIYFCFIGYA